MARYLWQDEEGFTNNSFESPYEYIEHLRRENARLREQVKTLTDVVERQVEFLGKEITRTTFRVHPVEECPPDRLYCVGDWIPHGESDMSSLRGAVGDHAERQGPAEDEQASEAGATPKQEGAGHAVPGERSGRMTRMIDDDPPIKTGASNQAYRDNWDRIFGEEEPDVTEEAARQKVEALCTQEGWNGTFPIGEKPPVKDEDAIEARIRLWGWKCKTCDKIVYDPENHQYHAIFKIGDPAPEEPR